MMKRSQHNEKKHQAETCDGDCLNESSLLSYGNKILKLRKRQGGDKEDKDYVSFIQNGQPLLPALKTALNEQLK